MTGCTAPSDRRVVRFVDPPAAQGREHGLGFFATPRVPLGRGRRRIGVCARAESAEVRSSIRPRDITPWRAPPRRRTKRPPQD